MRFPSQKFVVLGAGAALAMICVVATAIAAFPDDNVTTYTGCLLNGNVISVKAGDSPTQPCKTPATTIKLSGGDITSVNVNAPLQQVGTSNGLNGKVTIGLDSKYTLPDASSCTTGQVPKWNSSTQTWGCAADNDTKYTNGDGLDLSNSNQFSIKSGYQLPQGCANGEIPRSTGSNAWDCSSTGLSYVESTQSGGPKGLPDGAGLQDVTQVVLGAGTWIVIGKAVLMDGEDDRGFREELGDGCELNTASTTVDTAHVTLWDSNNGRGPVDFPLAMTGVVTGPATVVLQCKAQEDADQVEVSQGKIVAFRAS